MEIQCPSCQSIFAVKEAIVGRKYRCSVCRAIFVYSEKEENPTDIPPLDEDVIGGEANKNKILAQALHALENSSEDERRKKEESLIQVHDTLHAMLDEQEISLLYFKKGLKELVRIGLLVVFFIFLTAGSVVMHQEEKKEEIQTIIKTSHDTDGLVLQNVRQYLVQNDKLGNLFVIEGEVANNSQKTKNLITVEGTLYRVDKTIIAKKLQSCGIQLSLFQLQILSQRELDERLAGKEELYSKNIDVPSGTSTPFMFVFYVDGARVKEYGVSIVTAKNLEN